MRMGRSRVFEGVALRSRGEQNVYHSLIRCARMLFIKPISKMTRENISCLHIRFAPEWVFICVANALIRGNILSHFWHLCIFDFFCCIEVEGLGILRPERRGISNDDERVLDWGDETTWVRNPPEPTALSMPWRPVSWSCIIAPLKQFGEDGELGDEGG